ncbi:MAG: PAS domain S-box protein [Synergistaceae bacterium]|nr:PAS domain S-box protein [Synergistaceae bacterium]
MTRFPFSTVEEKGSEKELMLLFSNLFYENESLMLLIDPETGDILEANRAAVDFYGYPADELLGKKIFDLNTLPEEQIRARMEEAAVKRRGSFRFRHRKKSGAVCEVEVFSTVLDSNRQKVLCSIIHDITDTRRTEANLEVKSAFLAQLFSHAPLAIHHSSLDGRIISANRASEDIFGYSEDEMKGRFIDDLIALPETFEDALSNTNQVVAGETIFFEGARKRKNGGSVYVKGTAFPILLRGKLVGCYSIYMDQTPMKQAETRLRVSEERYRCLVEDIPAMVSSFDEGGRFSFVNRELCAFASRSPEELIGVPCFEFVSENSLETLKNHLKALSPSRPTVTVELTVIGGDGSTRWHRWTIRLFAEHPGGGREFHAVGQDITESKLVQTTLAENLTNMERTFSEAIEVLASATEAKDPYTSGHQRQVARLAKAIAEEMGYCSSFVRGVEQASLVHDIGKIEVPGEILSKPGKLSPLEFELIKCHSRAGALILSKIHLPWPLHDIVGQHHERMDGKGYPDGLRGDQILPEARIIAVADIVDAMASYRPYRPALGLEAGLMEIQRLRGTGLDENVVDACLCLFREKGFTLTV